MKNKIKVTENDMIICTEFTGPKEIVAISTNQDPEEVLLYLLDCIEKAKKWDDRG